MKKYYYKDSQVESATREVIVVKQEDICEEVSLSNCVYVDKADWETDRYNLRNYTYEDYGSDLMVDADQDILALDFNDMSDAIRGFFEFCLVTSSVAEGEGISNLIEQYKEYRDEEDEETVIITEEEIKKCLDGFEENNSFACDYSEKVVYKWDGSNHQRLLIDGEYANWYEYDELNELKEIDTDYTGNSTGHWDLVENAEGQQFLMYDSYYASDYSYTVYELTGTYDNIEDALEEYNTAKGFF